MKISFSDKSSIEIYKKNATTVVICVQAKDYNNANKFISNSVELTVEEFEKMYRSV